MSMPDMPALDYVVAQNNSVLAPSAVAFSQCQFNMVLCSNIRWGGWLGRHVDWRVGRHCQMGSLAGAAHLPKDNAGVLR